MGAKGITVGLDENGFLLVRSESGRLEKVWRLAAFVRIVEAHAGSDPPISLATRIGLRITSTTSLKSKNTFSAPVERVFFSYRLSIGL